jgi:hypothetical protein
MADTWYGVTGEAGPDAVAGSVTARYTPHSPYIFILLEGRYLVVLDKLRHNPKTACVPAIICSADTRGLRARQESFGAMGCLVIEKPFDIDALLTTVQESLAGGSQIIEL